MPPPPATFLLGVPQGGWWALLMGRWKRPTASLSGTPWDPPPSTARQLVPSEGSFLSFVGVSPTPSPKT